MAGEIQNKAISASNQVEVEVEVEAELGKSPGIIPLELCCWNYFAGTTSIELLNFTYLTWTTSHELFNYTKDSLELFQ